jgi:hypothetical protein
MQNETEQVNPVKQALQTIDGAIKTLRKHGEPLTTSRLDTQAVIAEALAPVFAEMPTLSVGVVNGRSTLRVRGMKGLRFPRALSDLSPEVRVARNVTLMVKEGCVVRPETEGARPVRVAELYTDRKTDEILKVVLAHEQDN